MSWGVGEQEQGVNKNIIYCLVFVLAGPLMHPERGILCASGPMTDKTYERWNCTALKGAVQVSHLTKKYKVC